MPVAAVPSGSLTWAVRPSLLRYVTVIAAGTFEASDDVVVDDDGGFTFPLVREEREGSDRRLSFRGSIRFQAHHGLLDIRIADPEVILGSEGGILVARTDEARQDVTALVRVAAIEPSKPDDGLLLWASGSSELLPDAVPLFGDVYPAGTEMAPFAARLAAGDAA